TIAEGVYLLKVPRPFTPPGDENNSSGPAATELSPAQIKAKLEHDPVLWNAKIEALRNVGLEVLEIVKAKKTDELWEAGGNLDEAGGSCHRQYWYPGERALLERIDRDTQRRYEDPQRSGSRGRGRCPPVRARREPLRQPRSVQPAAPLPHDDRRDAVADHVRD